MHLSVKIILSVAVASLALHAGLLNADQTKAEKPAARSIQGIWQGALKVGALELRLIVHVSKKPDGSYSGTLDSPDQGAKGIPLDEVSLKEKAVRLEFKKGGATFEGTLKEDGSEIKG